VQGELEHRRVKRFYVTTNKIKFAEGIAKRQRRERLLFKMQQLAQGRIQSKKQDDDNDELPFTAPHLHYHMSVSTKNYKNINAWIGDHSDDPAYEVSPRSDSLSNI
jgi:hypothetical protein